MTTRYLGAALLRRWYVVLVGLAVLAGMLVAVHGTPGVYWTRFDVRLVPPPTVNPNSLTVSQVELSSAASVLALDYNRGTAQPGPVSPDLTIVDEGVRHGAVVRMVDYGGQWSRSFRPAVNVQVADTDPAAVARRTRQITARLRHLLAERQAARHIPALARITAVVVPQAPVVGYRAGALTRAAAGTALAGLWAVAAAAVVVDRWALRRRARLSSARARG